MAAARRTARAVRDTNERVVTEHTWFQNVVKDHILLSARTHLLLIWSGLLTEVGCVIAYFVSFELPPDGYSGQYTYLTFPMRVEFANVFAALGSLFIIVSIGGALGAMDVLSELRRMSTLLSLVIGPWMIVSAALYDPDTNTTVLCPVFFRVWMVYRYAKTAVFSSSRISKPVQAITVQVIFMLTLVVMCVGLMQAAVMQETGAVAPFEKYYYLTIVTLSTVGYGNVKPIGLLARIVAMFEIFVAMMALPILTNDVGEVLLYLESQRGYGESTKHVIVVGAFSIEEAKMLFRELLDSDHRYTALHLVLVSPTKFDDEVVAFAKTHELKRRVTLCVGSPRNPAELARFAPRRADAVFFYSTSRAPAQRGDYQTILQAMLFRRHDKQLPQYFMLKHATHAHILTRTAFVIYDREAIKFSLIGNALKTPGFLAMFLNLFRPTSSSSTEAVTRRPKRPKAIKRAQDDSRGMTSGQLRAKMLQEQLERKIAERQRERERRKAKKAGIVLDDEDGEDDDEMAEHPGSNPNAEPFAGSSPNASTTAINVDSPTKAGGPPASTAAGTDDQDEAEEDDDWFRLYYLGARQSVYAVPTPEELEMRSFSSAALIMQLRAKCVLLGLVRGGRAILNPARVKVNMNDLLLVVAPSSMEAYDRVQRFASLRTSDDEGAAAITLNSALRQPVDGKAASAPTNCYPFKGHVIVVDVSSARQAFSLCSEEGHQAAEFRARALETISGHFPKTQPFVLVSLTGPQDPEMRMWERNQRLPICHLMGSPIDPEMIAMSCVSDARAVLILASEEGSDSATLRSTLITAQRTVLAELAQQTTRGTVPVIVLSDNLTDLELFEPRLNPDLPPAIAEDAEVNDHHNMAYATNGILATTMLDSLLFRTYFNQYTPQVIEQFLTSGNVICENVNDYVNVPQGRVARRMAKAFSFAQLCRILSGMDRVVLGIVRIVDTPERSPNAVGRVVSLTNPPPNVILRPTDKVLYLNPDKRYH